VSEDELGIDEVANTKISGALTRDLSNVSSPSRSVGCYESIERSVVYAGGVCVMDNVAGSLILVNTWSMRVAARAGVLLTDSRKTSRGAMVR
jgi:hypothetical protein